MPTKPKPTTLHLDKIHIAKAQLGLSDETYRDIIGMNFGGRSSAKDLNVKERAALLELFQQRGWQPKSPATVKNGRQATKRVNDNYRRIPAGPAAKQQRYVLALWTKLGYEVKKLDARCRQQFGIDRFEWLTDHDSLHILITDLQSRCRAAGLDPSPPSPPQHTPPLAGLSSVPAGVGRGGAGGGGTASHTASSGSSER